MPSRSVSDSELRMALQNLVRDYGLAKVYFKLREFPGYCGNCGTPLDKNEIHQPGNLGMCYIELQNGRKKPRRNDGEAKDIPG